MAGRDTGKEWKVDERDIKKAKRKKGDDKLDEGKGNEEKAEGM